MSYQLNPIPKYLIKHITNALRRTWSIHDKNRKATFIGKKECKTCGTKYDLQVDHIEPCGRQPQSFEELGLWTYKLFCKKENLQILCRSCNIKKGKKIVSTPR